MSKSKVDSLLTKSVDSLIGKFTNQQTDVYYPNDILDAIVDDIPDFDQSELKRQFAKERIKKVMDAKCKPRSCAQGDWLGYKEQTYHVEGGYVKVEFAKMTHLDIREKNITDNKHLIALACDEEVKRLSKIKGAMEVLDLETMGEAIDVLASKDEARKQIDLPKFDGNIISSAA